MKITKGSTDILIAIFLFTHIIAGCTSLVKTKPNNILNGIYPPFFKQIQKENSLLAKEIGKLPELKDGIQDNERSALKILCNEYKNNTKLFDHAFIQMYKIGLSDVREYCSPLQALFWIAQEGDAKILSDIINYYSLDNLLSRAWKFDPPVFSDDQLIEIIEDISDNKLREQYLRDRKISTNKQIQNFLLIDYRLNKKIFSKKSKKLLLNKNSSKHIHWSDFNIVVKRLNSPELVDYYEHAQIQWVDWRTLPSWPQPSSYVFKHGEGDCTAIADFTALCLKTGGYKAYELKLPPKRSVDAHHSICIFYVNGIKYVMDNGSPIQKGIHLYKDY